MIPCFIPAQCSSVFPALLLLKRQSTFPSSISPAQTFSSFSSPLALDNSATYWCPSLKYINISHSSDTLDYHLGIALFPAGGVTDKEIIPILFATANVVNIYFFFFQLTSSSSCSLLKPPAPSFSPLCHFQMSYLLKWGSLS